MRKTLTLLVASTALTTAIVAPAWSAMHAREGAGIHPFAALSEEGAQALPLVLVSGDDDDDHGEDHDSSHGGHDDDHDDNDGDDCDDDDGECRGGAGNPAPAGTVAPPKNGLLGTGAAPQVQVN